VNRRTALVLPIAAAAVLAAVWALTTALSNGPPPPDVEATPDDGHAAAGDDDCAAQHDPDAPLPQHLRQTLIDPDLGFDITALWEIKDVDGDPAHHGEPWDWPFKPDPAAPDGPYEEKDEAGTVRITGTLKGGKPDGTWREYDEAGTLRRFGQYIAGDQHGLWRAWYPNGARRGQGQYLADAPQGVFHEYHPSGNLWQKYAYDSEGYLHGPWLMWDDEGDVSEMGAYYHGEPDGPWWIWHASGQMTEAMEFDKGAEVGLFTEWDEHGAMIAQGNWDMGRPIDTWRCVEDGKEIVIPTPVGHRLIPSIQCAKALGWPMPDVPDDHH